MQKKRILIDELINKLELRDSEFRDFVQEIEKDTINPKAPFEPYKVIIGVLCEMK